MAIEARTIAAKLVGVDSAKKDIARAIVQKGGGVEVSPTDYDSQVEYLESTGTQYIDTGITGGSSSKIELVAASQNNSEYQALVGARNGTLLSFSIWQYSGSDQMTGPRFDYIASTVGSNPNIVGGTWNTSGLNTVVKDGRYNYLNGVQLASNDEVTFSCPCPFTLFAINNNGSPVFPAKCKMYSCRIYDSGVLVRDYIPVRKNGVGYLYDRVSKTLFGNAGTGAFVIGPDVATIGMPEKFADYGDRVRKIPQSLDSLPLEDEEKTWCIFVDCDANVVAVYDRNQTQQLTALPDVPDPPFDGLVDGEWNWTLAEVKASTMPMCIGPLYDTNDGKTWIDIDIPTDGYKWHLYFQDNHASNGRIDWGDGSELEAASLALHEHTYATAGTYRVKVFGTSNVRSISLGCSICGPMRSASAPNQTKDIHLVKRFAWATKTRNRLNILPYADNLEYLINAPDATTASVGLGEGCSKLKQLTLPRVATQGFVVGGAYQQLNLATSLKAVCFPPNMTRTTSSAGGWGFVTGAQSLAVARHSVPFTTTATSLGNNHLDGARSLIVYRYPGNVTPGTNSPAFRFCNCLKKLIMPEGFNASVTTIGGECFRDCFSLESLGGFPLNNVATLGPNAFYYCINLWKGETVEFPALTTINQNSLAYTGATKFVIGSSGTTLATNSTGQFGYNFGLKCVVFNGNVSAIRASCFNYCIALETVAFPNATAVPTLDNVNGFANTGSLKQIVVPDALYDTWIAATNWKNSAIVGKIVKASEAEEY